MSSGDEAVAAAAARARETAARNIPAFGDLPLPPDTANLREGADLDDALLALLPLVGVWQLSHLARTTTGPATRMGRRPGKLGSMRRAIVMGAM